MSGYQKIILMGRLGKDWEIKYTTGGTAIGNNTLATSESWTDKDGTKQERTEWHSLKSFGKQVETLELYTGKGQELFIEGKLQTSSWEKDGEKKYKTEVVVDSFTFVGGKKDNSKVTTNEVAW